MCVLLPAFDTFLASQNCFFRFVIFLMRVELFWINVSQSQYRYYFNFIHLRLVFADDILATNWIPFLVASDYWYIRLTVSRYSYFTSSLPKCYSTITLHDPLVLHYEMVQSPSARIEVCALSGSGPVTSRYRKPSVRPDVRAHCSLQTAHLEAFVLNYIWQMRL